MNIKKTAKKIVAVGSGVALAGATFMGALAAAPDLSQYPSQFVDDGQFDGKIVVGASAASQDIIGAIDIAASLQAASTEDVSVGDSTTTVDLEGEAKKIGDSGDILELYEQVDDVINTLTEDDLGMLSSGRITTQEGSTDYRQVIRIDENSDAQVVYAQDDERDELGYYLNVQEGDFLEYELSFPSGLKSNSDDGNLEHFEDETLIFMGEEYSIVNANLDASGDLTLDLIAGDVSDTLEQGQTRTYTVDGEDYEITVLVVGSGTDSPVKFLVNGEVTDSLSQGDTETLSDGMEIGVREVLQSSRAFEGDQGSIVEFYLGANKVTLSEDQIEVGNEDVNDASIIFDDNSDGTNMDDDSYSLRTITYSVNIESAEGSEIWMAEGETLSSWLDEPGSLLNPAFDVAFEGVTEPSTYPIEFTESGDDEYEFSFQNQRGDEYDVPYAYIDDSANVGFGEEGGDGFFFFEYINSAGGNIDANTFQIGTDDLFVLTDTNETDEDADSWVYRFDDVDEDDEVITFVDEASGDEVEEQYDASNVYNSSNLGTNVSKSGELTVSGIDYDFWLYDDGTNFHAAIDLNNDGEIAGEAVANDATESWEIVNVVTNGGGILQLHDNETSELTTPATFDIVASLTTVADDLDEGGDETQTITIGNDGSEEFNSIGVSGGTSFSMAQDDDNDDRSVGVNKYGTWFEVDGDDAPNLEIAYPSEQVEGLVYVIGGDVERSTSTSGQSAQRLNVLPVGIAVLDSEFSEDQDNAIVVGGPCANTVAADLLGNPSDCTEGFQAGMGMIRSFETGDNVAILVAGYSARDTVESSRILARAATEDVSNFSGDSVEVVIAGENDVSVRAAAEESDDSSEDEE